MISIIDYKAGNIASVSNAFRRLGADFTVTSHIRELESSDAIVFPGVGHALAAMEALRDTGIDVFLKNTKLPVLGICLGMQLLFEYSDEGDTRALDIIPGRLKKFDSTRAKVPHMGWNSVEKLREHPVVSGIESGSYFYHVHSYYAPAGDYTIASGEYIHSFASIVAFENYTGVQFHPEKSGEAGEKLLQNFLNMIS